MKCRTCNSAAKRQAKFWKLDKIPFLDSYENIHALHKIILSIPKKRKQLIRQAIKKLTGKA